MDSKQKDNNIKDISISDNPARWSKYVSLKGQKLTQAVYLVTSLFPDSEPLKWRLRDVSLDILSDISMLQPANYLGQDLSAGHQISPIFKTSVLESATDKISQLLSWLEVSLAGNFASDLNLALLRQEYNNFNEILHERIKTTGLLKLVSTGEESLLPLISIGQKPSVSRPFVSDKQKIVESSSQPYQKISHLPHKNRDLAKDSRRSLIINFLKGKDWTSIKDIADTIDGCSAKTIQRELADLVQQGVLKKKGDRRWSRYLLA